MSSGLRRDLGLPAAVSVVVGSMIGVGIFLGPTEIAPLLATPGLVLLAWVLGGLLIFTGALTYAELGAAMPESGGIYAYMREGYGRMLAFFTGWSGFAVGKAASTAVLAVAFGSFLLQGISLVAPHVYEPGSTLTRTGTILIAVTLIVILTGVNMIGVRYAGALSVFTMAVKLGAIGLVVIAGIALLGGGLPDLAAEPFLPADQGGLAIMSAFGLALVPIFFAYDGWVNSTQVAEEVRDPGRNVPRSLILGVLAVGVAYTLVTLVYFLALGTDGVGEEGAAARTAEALVGPVGAILIIGAILISIIGTINAVTLSGPRIAFAMARDGVFFEHVERVNRFGVPAWSIGLQGLISIVLVVLPPIGGRPLFSTLLDYIIIDSFIFYALGAGAIFIFRKKRPDMPRPYRVPLYPIVPIIFITLSVAFLVNALVTRPLEALGGIGIVLTGLPIYWWNVRRSSRAPPKTASPAAAHPATPPDAPAPAATTRAPEPDTEPSTPP